MQIPCEARAAKNRIYLCLISANPAEKRERKHDGIHVFTNKFIYHAADPGKRKSVPKKRDTKTNEREKRHKNIMICSEFD